MTAPYGGGACLAPVGGIFPGQGPGYIGGSSMTGSTFWAVVGAVLIAAAAVLVWVTRRPSTR
jgi:hypothetical protein